jgi:hypothetical protein
VTHGGKTGVAAWYQRNIVPRLGDGDPQLRAWDLSGALAPSTSTGRVAHVHRPVFAGTALPRSTVYLFGGPARAPWELSRIGRAVTSLGGQWRLRTKRLVDGLYRIAAVAAPPRRPAGHLLRMLPTAPLGRLVVATRRDVAG